MLAGSTAVGLFGINNITTTGGGSLIPGSGINSEVPAVFASLFTESSEKTGVPSALIAALYLTEHHTDSFGKDLPSVNATFQEVYGSPCEENGSGAAGPMQFIPKSWSGVVPNLKKVGISSPDRCNFRDSIMGAGFLLKGKLKFKWVADVCKVDSDGKVKMTDECVSRWGQAYCGVKGCNNSACGAPDYLYCEEVLRKYKLVVEAG